MPNFNDFDEQEFLREIARIEGNLVEEEKPVKKKDKIVVGITYSDFLEYFRKYFPDIRVITSPEEVSKFDLIIVPGGEDVNPILYNEPNYYSYINDFRDNKEVPIVKQAITLKKKIYAVCRGHQLVNVIVGGSLYQDLLEQAEQTHPRNHPLEDINDEVIKKYFGKKDIVSTHHQAVKYTPLTVTSTYHGIIESCKNRHIISTQFHPEFEDGNEDFFKYLADWASY